MPPAPWNSSACRPTAWSSSAASWKFSCVAAMVRLGELGFILLPRRGWRSLVLAVAAGLAFGVYMAAADRLVFASVVPEVQHRMLAGFSLGERLLLFARGALIDEFEFR